MLAALTTLGERLGVPAFVVAVLVFTLIPRIDRGIEIADRVDAELQILISRCGPAPVLPPLP